MLFQHFTQGKLIDFRFEFLHWLSRFSNIIGFQVNCLPGDCRSSGHAGVDKISSEIVAGGLSHD